MQVLDGVYERNSDCNQVVAPHDRIGFMMEHLNHSTQQINVVQFKRSPTFGLVLLSLTTEETDMRDIFVSRVLWSRRILVRGDAG